ncbi:hypothetical protein GLOIN_2v1878590, partial [Rhizophagus irregularis DAOM 181602=DAOM 197198]
MSCSKILLGDLPELTSDILEYLRDDIPTLRSCILLWKDPFSMKYPKNFRFIDIYLQRLNEQDKAKLSEYGVNKNLFLSNSLFNYSMFIKNLNTQTICFSIVNWIKINKVITCSAGFIFLLLI